jgi:HEAT repeat protein
MSMKFDEVIRALREDKPPLPKVTIRRLSNLDEEEQRALVAAWGGVPLETRRSVLRSVAEMVEAEFDTDFSAITRLAMTDLDDSIREAAIEASWPDETPTLFNRLLPMASVDPSPAVRASAWEALGRFVLAAELGKFSQSLARQAQNAAIRQYRNPKEDVDVRRRALEALANSSRDEVAGLIEDAYSQNDTRMRASAIYAMGRSCDDKWSDAVLSELDSDDPAVRYEAVRASGELGLEESIPQIAALLVDGERQFIEMAVWSLGEIGGAEAQRLLNSLVEYAEERDDSELLELVEDAIASASLAGGGSMYEE